MITEFLTPGEIAVLLKLNTLTVYSYIRRGNLKAIRFGRSYRITKRDFDIFIRAHRT